MHGVAQLIRIKHGSHLYGTSTPSSDQDFKGVHLPSGRAIILQRTENHIQRNVVSKIEGTDKNSSDAIDDESFSVQRFFDMLMKGDTVATEILFAPLPEVVDFRWDLVQMTGKSLLNRQCKGFVGYCVRQAAKYGIKGSRMGAVKDTLSVLNHLLGVHGDHVKLGAVEGVIRKMLDGREHISWENIPSPNGTDLWHFVVCDRKMPVTVLLTEVIKVFEKVWKEYGERSRKAMDNEGIDWKAMSHAVRVAGQAHELLLTGNITFPRPDAAELLRIKLGEYSYDDVSKLLERRVQLVHEASKTSALPEQSDHKLADSVVQMLYERQV